MTAMDRIANRLPYAPPDFNWGLHPEAEEFLTERLEELLAADRFARELADRMSRETATQLFDWVDHLVLADEPATRARLTAVGFVADPFATAPFGGAPADESPMFHPLGNFPKVVLRRGAGREPNRLARLEVALRVERLADLVRALDLPADIEGPLGSRYRRLLVSSAGGTALTAVERLGYRGYLHEYPEAERVRRLAQVAELWQTRPRGRLPETDAFDALEALADHAFALVGREAAGHLFFESERAYWTARNSTARFQKARQEALGLGWANHDHHTYRSSRSYFSRLVGFLEKLGFHLRERYWAGAEAGWGAQIVEHPVLEIVCFNDVDLSPTETELDFAHQPLAERDTLGTVGLWCALHGESMLTAGMHHLECRFDFEQLKTDLESAGRRQMRSFSDFTFLKQAFTEGERWRVDARRADRLRESGRITPEQAEKFLAEGAIGSHLENLQRWQGFKGFNQKSVSVIIAATDPRKSQF